MSPAPKTTTGFTFMFGGTRDGEAPYLDASKGKSNCSPPKRVDLTATDIRTMAQKPLVDVNGYQVIDFTPSVDNEDLLSDKKELIEDAYFKDVAKAVKDTAGCAEVIPFVYRIRNEASALEDVVSGKVRMKTSLPLVHCDRDDKTAPQRLVEAVGEDRAAELLAKYPRFAVCNIWKPIVPVQKWPLLMVNHDNIPNWHFDTHIAPVKLTAPGAADADAPAKDHQSICKEDDGYTYYYASDMTTSEAWCFYAFSSDVKKAIPHGAFWDNSSSDNVPSRASIEVRTFAFFES